jgi:hypothetical protein
VIGSRVVVAAVAAMAALPAASSTASPPARSTHLFLTQTGDCTKTVYRTLATVAGPSHDCPSGSAAVSGNGRVIIEDYPTRGSLPGRLAAGDITGVVSVRTVRAQAAPGSAAPDQAVDYASVDFVVLVAGVRVGSVHVEGTYTASAPLTAPVKLTMPASLVGRSVGSVVVRAEWATTGLAGGGCYGNEVLASAAALVYRGLSRKTLCVNEPALVVSGAARSTITLPVR